MSDNDNDVVFNATALDVVSSWLSGSNTAISKDEKLGTSNTKPPVQLYKQNAVETNGYTNYVPTNRKLNTPDNTNFIGKHNAIAMKLVRKSGREKRDALERKENEKLYKEDSSDEDTLVKGTKIQKTLGMERPVEVQNHKTPFVQSKGIETNLKRKRSAQEEIIDKLRAEAARKKARNLKSKLRQQRKKAKQKALLEIKHPSSPVVD